MREAAIKPEQVLVEHEPGLITDPVRQRTGVLTNLVVMAVGSKIRFLTGAALLAGSIAWMHQNALISAEHASAIVEAAKAGDIDAIQSHAAGRRRTRPRRSSPADRIARTASGSSRDSGPGIILRCGSRRVDPDRLVILCRSSRSRSSPSPRPQSRSWARASGCRASAGSTRASSRASSGPGCWRPDCYLVAAAFE